jgi:hypothetical protein
MRVVEPLCCLQDILQSDPTTILKRLTAILNDRHHGAAIRDDLRQGLHTLPIWMQSVVRKLIGDRTRHGMVQHVEDNERATGR